MNGIVYCRVSSKEQIEGTSLESQELACREYAGTHQVNIVKIFVGRGESAKFADRPELIELLDFCRKNKGTIQVLIVWKLDRFARNVADHFNLKATLLKYGVRVVSVTEPIDANPEGKLLETILAGFAQFDNDIRAMRTVQGMKRKLQDGIFPWKTPLGYQSSTSSDEKKTEPDRPEQPMFALLQKAWHEFSTGTYTKAEIRRLMAHWGIVSRNGRPLPPQSIDNLFRNKYYAGILTDPWSGEVYEGKHIPMVSRHIFTRVQEIVSRRNRSQPHQKQRPEFPLRGLVRCPGCMKYMTAAFSQGRSKVYGYYCCQARECSSRRNYPAATIHAEFRDFLMSLSIRPGLMTKLEETIAQKAEERQAFAKSQQARKETEIRGLNQQIQQLIQMRTKELLNDKEFREQKGMLSERKLALEAAVSQRATDLRRVRAQLRDITAPLTNLVEIWDRFDQTSRERFKRVLLPVGFLAGQTRTAEKALLFSLIRDSDDPNSSLVPLTGEFLNRIYEEIKKYRPSRHSFGVKTRTN